MDPVVIFLLFAIAPIIVFIVIRSIVLEKHKAAKDAMAALLSGKDLIDLLVSEDLKCVLAIDKNQNDVYVVNEKKMC